MSQNDKKIDPDSTGNSQTESGPGGISRAFRPLVKELVKAGLVVYETVSEKASGLGKQLNDLVEEARSEAVKTSSPDSAPEETKAKSREGKSGKTKDQHKKA
ncbi:MAG: hypothetical protein NPIRA03_19630 [Nitrospirales bacterium]|nr:MAG: hypothetical protein NPIRA03_19630 [Nitrospirales bacterium]